MHARSHDIQGSSAAPVGLLMQDGQSCGTWQMGQWPHQGEWAAPGDDPAAHTAIQVSGTCSASGEGVICQGGHANPVKGGGHVAQIYAIHQSISKALVAYYQKHVDEASKKEIEDILSSTTRPCW